MKRKRKAMNGGLIIDLRLGRDAESGGACCKVPSRKMWISIQEQNHDKFDGRQARVLYRQSDRMETTNDRDERNLFPWLWQPP
jgi:hypothetical protein